MRKKYPELIEIEKIIRELRKEKGYSQESFAHEVGLDRTWDRWGAENATQ